MISSTHVMKCISLNGFFNEQVNLKCLKNKSLFLKSTFDIVHHVLENDLQVWGVTVRPVLGLLAGAEEDGSIFFGGEAQGGDARGFGLVSPVTEGLLLTVSTRAPGVTLPRLHLHSVRDTSRDDDLSGLWTHLHHSGGGSRRRWQEEHWRSSEALKTSPPQRHDYTGRVHVCVHWSLQQSFHPGREMLLREKRHTPGEKETHCDSKQLDLSQHGLCDYVTAPGCLVPKPRPRLKSEVMTVVLLCGLFM